MADANAGQYPAGNTFPSSETFRAQFASYAFGDYTLVPTSIWLRAGTDGLDLGAGLTTHPPPVPPTGLRIAPQ
jgi:hypothetical protein